MLAAGIYRALLYCYPSPFRHEYGAEMLAAFAAQIREARRHGGWWAAVCVEFQTIVDVLYTAPKEHYHVTRLDLRYALRALVLQPGFTAVAVLSLALGIGANVAIFSLLNSVLLRSLPVRDPQSLVMLTNPGSSGLGNGSQGGERTVLTYTEFEQLRDQTGVFSTLMASESELDQAQARIGSGQPEEVRFRMVSNEYFDTLGSSAFVGQTVKTGDPLQSRFAVISYEFWQRRFGGRADAVGRKLSIHKSEFTVVGVMPPSFFGETVGDQPDMWLPLGMQPTILPGRDYLHERPQDPSKDMWLHVFGRLKPGITLDRAQARANFIFKQNLESFYNSRLSPDKAKTFLNQRLKLRPAATGASELRGQAEGPLKLLLAASGLVLLIACANLGNLLLARMTARTRELAVRSALGASRPQLIRQVATESLLLAVLGGITSLFTAWFLRAGLVRLLSEDVRLAATPDVRVLAFAFSMTLLASVAVGLMPVLRTLSVDIVTGLKEQGRGLTGSSAWLRAGRAVVAGQLALSLPLLVGAGLLLQTLNKLQHVNIGFETEHILSVDVDVLAAGYQSPQQFRVLSDLLKQIQSVPGVRAATFSNYGFLTGNDSRDSIEVENYVPKGKEDRHSHYEYVAPGFFSTLGIPIRFGREINNRDGPAHKVCVINEAFAQLFFAGRSPLGMHVTQKFGNDVNALEIVGVVNGSRQRALRGAIEPRFYVPASTPLSPMDSAVFEIKAAGDPLRILTAVRKTILSWNSDLVIADARPLTAMVDKRITQDRILGRLSTVFGIVGLLLAAVGLYGVLSYAVARRTSEIGLRKALGARGNVIIAMILRETSWLLAIGLGAGAALTVAAVQLIRSRLYRTAPLDPLPLASAVALLVFVAIVAAWIPAFRASRVDPLVALRYE